MTRFQGLMAFFLSGAIGLGLSFLVLGTAKPKAKPSAARMTYEQQKEAAHGFASSLKPGDCFRYENTFPAEHSFEKTHDLIDHVHVVLAADQTALLIAQPEPDCKADENESAKCDYWFRTMELNDPFLTGTGKEKKVACPPGLTRNDMIKRLRADRKYSKQYEVSE